MTAAWISLGLCAAGWFWLRWAEESQRIDDLCKFIMTVDLDHDAEVGS